LNKASKAIAWLSLLACTVEVQAALIDEGLITVDSSTGLQWLDLTQSNGYSFAQMTGQLAAGGQFAGWRIATAAEVANILTQVGFPVTPYQRFETFSTVNGQLVVTPQLTQQIAAFDSLFGLNVHGLGPAYGFEAEVSDVIPGASTYHPLFYGTGSLANTQFASDANSGVTGNGSYVYHEVTTGYEEHTADANTAFFLVQAIPAVPDPSTYSLMLMGLAAVGWCGGRRRGNPASAGHHVLPTSR
jgi:hypothetical protein